MLCFPVPPPSMILDPQLSQFSHVTSDRPGSAKRPKLSLQTRALDVPRIHGSSGIPSRTSSTFGGLNSATVRNTYKNTYETDCPLPSPTPSSPVCSTPVSTRSFSAIRLSTILTTQDSPYRQPKAVRSILRNSPLSKIRTGPTSPPTPPYREPVEKQVSFSSPLEEDIKNVDYTLTHLDALEEEGQTTIVSPKLKEVKSPRSTKCSTLTIDPAKECSREDTPILRKREKKRKWVWTLGALEEDEDDSLAE